MISLNKFKELPIGTVFKTNHEGFISFEVKCSDNCIIVIDDFNFPEWVGKKLNVVDRYGDLEYMFIADKSISDLIHITKEASTK